MMIARLVAAVAVTIRNTHLEKTSKAAASRPCGFLVAPLLGGG